MAHTLAQKILQRHTDEEVREAGQIVRCKVSAVLANDITAPLAIKSFRGMGADRVFDKDRVYLVMDHFTPQKDIDSANQVMVTRAFAAEMGVTRYYEGGECGVEHALLPEQGLVGPGDILVGADSQYCVQKKYALFCPFFQAAVVRNIAAQVAVEFFINVYQRRGNVYIFSYREAKAVGLSIVMIRILTQNNYFYIV